MQELGKLKEESKREERGPVPPLKKSAPVTLTYNEPIAKIRTDIRVSATRLVAIVDAGRAIGYKNPGTCKSAWVRNYEINPVPVAGWGKTKWGITLAELSIVLQRTHKTVAAERFSAWLKKQFPDEFDAPRIIHRPQATYVGMLKEAYPDAEAEAKIGKYRADLLLRAEKIVVEIDENHESYNQKKEHARATYLKKSGYMMVRIIPRETNVGMAVRLVVEAVNKQRQ